MQYCVQTTNAAASKAANILALLAWNSEPVSFGAGGQMSRKMPEHSSLAELNRVEVGVFEDEAEADGTA